MRFYLQLAAIGMVLVAGTPALAQYQHLLKRIPQTANSVVVFDVDGVLNSPTSKAGGWKEEHRKAFDDGLVIVPPGTSRFVLASQMDFEFMTPVWDVALMDVAFQATPQQIADERGGTVDNIGGLDAAVLPNDVTVVQFEPRTWGSMAPANRQAVARWLRSTSTDSIGALSKYLVEAVGFVENFGTPVILAIDLQDAVSSEEIRQGLAASHVLVNRTKVDRDKLAQLISGIRGVTLGITFAQQPFGKIKVDFSQEVSSVSGFATVARPLFLEFLSDLGVMIEDLETWKSAVRGKQLTLEGHLSENGLRRVLSVVDAPTSLASSTSSPAAPQGEEASVARTTKKYFDSIDALLDDLEGKNGTASHINQYGVWFERYAGKIESLPVLNVDEEMIEYGSYMSNRLRQASLAVKSRGIRTRVRQVNASAQVGGPYYRSWGGATFGRFGRYGYYGGYSYRTPQETLQRDQTVRTQIKAQEKASMATNVIGILDDIEKTRAETRRKMTQKYQLEF